jgi:hypothetical protein
MEIQRVEGGVRYLTFFLTEAKLISQECPIGAFF